jgi:hypothetical protein
MSDAPDSAVKVPLDNIIFDSENHERRSWVFFGKRIPRSQVLFSVQVLVVLIVVCVSVVNLTLSTKCEEIAPWIALLSSSIGYMLPSPKL